MLAIASSEVCPLSSKPPSERESAAVRPSVRACATRASDSLGLFGLSPFDGRASGREGREGGFCSRPVADAEGGQQPKKRQGREEAEGGGLD